MIKTEEYVVCDLCQSYSRKEHPTIPEGWREYGDWSGIKIHLCPDCKHKVEPAVKDMISRYGRDVLSCVMHTLNIVKE